LLEYPDANGNHDYNVQNCLDASRHRDIRVDKPQTNSHDDQPQDDIHNNCGVSGKNWRTVEEPSDDTHGDQCQDNIEQWHFYTSKKIEAIRIPTSVRARIIKVLEYPSMKTKRGAVEQALRILIRLRRQAEIRRLRGKLNWQGDLNAMRSDS
jgi:Arc/MetJ family transcription regulator